MAGPWDNYKPAAESGPWSKYKPADSAVTSGVFGSPEAARKAITGDVVAGPDTNGEGFFKNPNTGQMTSRELLRGAQSDGLERGNVVPRMAGHGATLGTSDEAVGLGAYLGSGLDPEQGKFALENERAKIEAMRQKYPYSSLASEMLGGMGIPASILASEGKALTAAGAIKQSAKSGAAIGGLYAAGEGEGFVDRFQNIPAGAAAGAVGGALAVPVGKAVIWAAKKVGKPIARLFSDPRYYNEVGGLTPAGKQAVEALGYSADEVSTAFKREFSKGVDEGLDPASSAVAAEFSEFGVPAYQQNVTGDIGDFANFERARTGGVGPASVVKKAQRLGAEQDAAMRQAPDAIATRIGEGVRGDQVDAAQAVSGQLEILQAAEKAAAKAAYRAADDAGFTVPAEIAKGVHQRLETRLAAEEIDLTSDLFAKTRGYMSRLAKRGEGDGDVSLRLIDTFRKDLNRSMSRADSEDLRALTIVKQEYDKWVDDIVEARLFNGSDDAITSLKQARTLWSAYAKKYMGKDAGSKFIRDMIDQDASPEQVAQWLFGATKMGNGRMNSKLAATLRETLGADSQEWNLLRQAAFRKITQKPGTENPVDSGTIAWGPQKVSQNIFEFFRGSQSRLLANELFTKAERAEMLRLANVLKRTVPPKGATNPSGTAYEIARQATKGAQSLMEGMAFLKGGPIGAGAMKAGNWLANATTGAVQGRNIGRVRVPKPVGLPGIGAVPAAQGATSLQDQYQRGRGPR